jgi:hypothetical protein
VGGRDVTPLFATMYAGLKIAERRGDSSSRLPRSLPELVLLYLNFLNRDAPNPDAAARLLHADAKRIAWCVVFRDFRPAPAPRAEVLKAMGGEDADARLADYESRVRLVQTVGAGRDRVRFVLDPIAEYLAALHAIETNGARAPAWRALTERLESHEPGEIRGFLTALAACAGAPEYRDHLPPELRTFVRLGGSADGERGRAAASASSGT